MATKKTGPIFGEAPEHVKSNSKKILETEFSPKFVRGMEDRMIVSFHKYGFVKDAVGKVDFIQSLHKRLDKYAKDCNTEWLMDVGNFAMMEFMFPSHKKAHFKATDSHESPGRFIIDDSPYEDEIEKGYEGGRFTTNKNKDI